MADKEQRLLGALVSMTEQYLENGAELDSMAMNAGERALEVLAEYGLVTLQAEGRFGRWTKAGDQFRNSN